jgi:ATP-dependent DNA ligase
MLAILGDRLPTGPEWSYEAKWDGYRALLIKRGSSVQLRSRRDADFTASYSSLVAAGRSLRARDVILDGEIVALDADGHPSFQALQHRSTPGTFVIAYYGFDILSLNGHSLTDRPPAQLEALVRRYGLEGIVAKRLDSRYEAGLRTGAWTKVKFSLAAGICDRRLPRRWRDRRCPGCRVLRGSEIARRGQGPKRSDAETAPGSVYAAGAADRRSLSLRQHPVCQDRSLG